MTTPASRPPMTEAEARENVAAMKAETPRNAQVRLLTIAVGPMGNLSAAAREVYAARLRELEAE